MASTRLSDNLYHEKVRRRLVAMTVVAPSGCWEWQGFLSPKGYGSTGYRCKSMNAHRVAWLAFRGPIPEGMMVCHQCDNRKCINPHHLWLGSMRANAWDARLKGRHHEASKTHCVRGHRLEGANLQVTRQGGHKTGIRRVCVACQRARNRIKAGWPEDLAYSAPITPAGFRPVNGKFPRRRPTIERPKVA